MWKRIDVEHDGVTAPAMVSMEGPRPGVPAVIEWPERVPVNMVFTVAGADWHAVAWERCGGLYHLKLSPTPRLLAPPEAPRPPPIVDFVIPLAEDPEAETGADPKGPPA